MRVARTNIPTMSIHAKPNEEAQAKLHSQKRNSTISSIVISILAVVLIFLGLGIFLLPTIMPVNVSLVVYPPVKVVPTEPEPPKTRTSTTRKPTPPSYVPSPVIVSATLSPVSIPAMDHMDAPPSVDFGNLEDLGEDNGTMDFDPPSGFEGISKVLRNRCSKEDRIARLQEMGGNPLAEGVVEKGLEWLKASQNAEGSWTKSNQSAMTGFAVLAYLGRCETPLSEKYGESCLRGITWLVNLGMKTDGKLSTNLTDKHWPYEHAIATYALCEAATFCNQGKIHVPHLTEIAEKATAIILANQHTRSGGWDYAYDSTGGRGGDLSLAAWHIQALKAAHHAGIEPKGMTRAKNAAIGYAESLQNKHGGFGYTSSASPAGGGTYFTMTGGGILGLQMWGKGNSSAVRKGAKYILENSKFDYNGVDSNLYAHYYESQAMINRGGKEWETYNTMFKDQLITSQNPNGSWKPSGGIHFDEHYRNCLNILMLEVYYRFLPGTGNSGSSM